MMKRMKGQLTFANVMSVIAVFLALGGTAFAVQLGKNTVGSKQLKKNAVTGAKVKAEAITEAKVKAEAITGAKVKADAITGAKVLNGSLTGADLAPASIDQSKLAPGTTGIASIPNGSVGSAKLGTIDTHIASVPLPDNTVLQRAVASCAAGEKLLSGGVNLATAGPDILIQASRPSNADSSTPTEGEPFTSWETSAINKAGETGATTLFAWAVCLR
jgi:hypothetical protein